MGTSLCCNRYVNMRGLPAARDASSLIRKLQGGRKVRASREATQQGSEPCTPPQVGAPPRPRRLRRNGQSSA